MDPISKRLIITLILFFPLFLGESKVCFLVISPEEHELTTVGRSRNDLFACTFRLLGLHSRRSKGEHMQCKFTAEHFVF